MKKTIPFFLAALLLLGTLAACDTPDTADTKDATDSSNSQQSQSDEGSGLSDANIEELAYTSLFEGDQILTMNIEMAEEDWSDLLENATDKEYYSATVTVNGITLENVGVRAKGNSTLRSVAGSDSDRYSLRIKFDKYVDGQELLGLDEMVVNSNYADPSYLREYLTYEGLASIGLQVPLTAFVNLSINGELFGFYLGIEAVDDSLLKRFYGNNDGNLYKAEERSTLVYQEGSTYDTLDQKNGKDKSREDLVEFVRILGEMDGEKGQIESVLDVDSALKYIAGMTVLGSYDSYSGIFAHNYYLCANDGIFTVIPWDYNMSFGGFQDGGDASTTIPIDEPVYGVTMESRPLIQNLLAVPAYRERYHEYVSQLADYLEGFEERLVDIAAIIRPYVQADPTKFYTMEAFESNLVDAGQAETTPAAMDASTDSQPPEISEMSTGEEPVAPPSNDMPNVGGEQQADPPGRSGEPGGRGGFGGGMQSAGSILTYAKERLENVRKQLSGELETTGNTTMESGGRGFFGGMGDGAPPDLPDMGEGGFNPGDLPDGQIPEMPGRGERGQAGDRPEMP